MLNRLIEASLRNQVLVVALTALVAACGIWAVRSSRVDAIPDLSDVQVIVYAEFPGQAPQVVEDQVTYPITTKMLAVPHATVVRGYSYFGFSFVYVLFEDGTDPYWARSRVLEYLSGLSSQLPRNVSPRLGPDATGVGWAFMYVLNSPQRSLAELRSIQDWYLRYALTSVDGVSEVASVGGFVREYQVEVDPVRLRGYGLTIGRVAEAIEKSNSDAGGGSIEITEREIMVRGLGYVRDVRDLERVAVALGPNGVPVTLQQVARVTIGPEMRRGIADWNGEGETVGGIVVVRADADTRRTIDGVKARLAELEAGLPEDVAIEVAYDRSALIDGAIHTLATTLVEESLIVALLCVVFLFHLRSAFVAVVSIPVSLLAAFIVMKVQGIGANIMSLGGIAISIGVLVDCAVVMVENAHVHLAEDRRGRSHFDVILRSAQEVGPTLFATLLVITVSFLPVFMLEEQAGRLFKPLAFTKTYALAAACVLAVTLVPVLMFWFVRGRIRSERENPVSRVLHALYAPVLDFAVRWRWLVILGGIAAVASTAVPLKRMGSEFMPALWEGDLLYMPTTFPGVSVTKAREILQHTDREIRRFPEVESVFGKAGRAETATDPAPLDMIETTIRLKPQSEWRPGMTQEKLIEELDRALQVPGLTNSWTQPIRTRIDMLSTGIKTPVGIKIAGSDLALIERVAKQVEGVVRALPGTRSAYAERVMGGSYLDFDIDRDAIARYGLTVDDVQDVIASAIGGMTVSQAVEGLERYPISVRYPRELRDSLPALGEALVATPTGAQVPLRLLARMEIREGPMAIKSENARLNAWVYVDLEAGDIGRWLKVARRAVAEQVEVPQGTTIFWSGQFEQMERVRNRLLLIVPLTLVLVVGIMYLGTRSLVKTGIVLLAVPFSLVGAVWFLDLLGYNWSVAVWVGMIALAGLDAETGTVMLLYLDLAHDKRRREGRLNTLADLVAAIHEGGVLRIRPKMMTVLTDVLGLMPLLWATGAGSDVMRRVAAPLVGGMATSFVGELVIYPALYFLWRARQLRRAAAGPPGGG